MRQNRGRRRILGWLTACVLAVGGPAYGGVPEESQDQNESGPATASQPANGVDSFDDLLRKIRKKRRVPSLAALAIRGDDIIASGAVGVRKSRSKAKVTIDDTYHLGSCTKSMTATLCAIIVEEGKLRWDSTVGEVFPDLKEGFNEKLAGVTLEQLLCHRGGLPEDRQPDLTIFPRLLLLQGEITSRREEMVKIVLAQTPATEPGTDYAYSNLGFAIAGAMCEKVTGESYETLMSEKLFKPLGMKSAGFGAPGIPKKIDQPRGHSKTLGITSAIAPGDMGSDNPQVIAPCGTAHSSLPDWAKYAALHLNAARGKPKLLQAKTFKKLHTDVFDQEYAFGWVIVDRPWAGGRVLVHDGSNGMWYAMLFIAPEKNLAFMVATNMGNEDAVDACHEAAAAMRDRYAQ